MKNGLQWFKGLGGLAKTLVIASGLIVGGGIADVVNSPEQPVVQEPIQQVQAAVTEKKTEKTTEIIPFSIKETKTSSLDKGVKRVSQEGKNGVRTYNYEVTYVDGVEVDRVWIGDEITKKPIAKRVLVGTYVAPPPSEPKPAASLGSNCSPHYTGGCVPIASDVDCAGGSGNGPEYVRGPVYVVDYDPYGLDGDGDGIGCE